MKILVCIKQVPDMESRFKVNSSGLWFDEADLAWRMKFPRDLFKNHKIDERAMERLLTPNILPHVVKIFLPIMELMACYCPWEIEIDEFSDWARGPP